MIYIKTPSQVDKIEEANKIGAEFLQICRDFLVEGVITHALEGLAEKFCKKHKVRPSFYEDYGFPSLLCVSVNDEILHGLPNSYVIKNGDIVSVDFGVEKDGYFSDAAFTKKIGPVSEIANRLVETTEECLYLGIGKAYPGNRLHDISQVIHEHALSNGFDVIRDYMGHGVGFQLHESPDVLNYISIGVNWELKPGMVIAIEPLLVEDSYETKTASNNWTVSTADGKLSAHFEHSIVITNNGPRILSKL